MRSRLTLRTPALSIIVRALTALLLLALFWYGLMAVLLAVKVSPRTVNGLSAYRTLFNAAYNLRAHDFTTLVRLACGFGGVLVFLLFVFLALQELPRPALVRGGDVGLEAGDRGSTTVRARVVERVAEITAERHADVAAASGRLHQDSLDVSLDIARAEGAAGTLQQVQADIAQALARHDLPRPAVNVLLSRYSPDGRGLS